MRESEKSPEVAAALEDLFGHRAQAVREQPVRMRPGDPEE